MASVRKCGSLLVLAAFTILALSSTVSSQNYGTNTPTSSSINPGTIAGPIVGIVVCIIIWICLRMLSLKKAMRRPLRPKQGVRTAQILTLAEHSRPESPQMPTPNITTNQNASQAIVFFVPIESNNQAEAPTDTTSPEGTSATQPTPQASLAPFEPPRYSSLNCDVNAGLPNYDSRDPNYRAMNPSPAYFDKAGGAAPFGQNPLPYEPKPDKSSFGLGSSPDEAGYANMGYSSDAATEPPTSSHRDTDPSAPARDSIYNN